MSERIVQCVKLSRPLPGIDEAPFPNEIGQRIYEGVSKEAWKMWLEHSKMLINEYRIDLASMDGYKFLLKRCEDFFFGEGSALPPDFVPQAAPQK